MVGEAERLVERRERLEQHLVLVDGAADSGHARGVEPGQVGGILQGGGAGDAELAAGMAGEGVVGDLDDLGSRRRPGRSNNSPRTKTRKINNYFVLKNISPDL